MDLPSEVSRSLIVTVPFVGNVCVGANTIIVTLLAATAALAKSGINNDSCTILGRTSAQSHFSK